MTGTASRDDPMDVRPESLLGRIIAGKFQIEAIIGSGAMGVVYRARQTALDKVVAIKVLHTSLGSKETFAARFHLEAKAASRLDHPNSIRILDFGEEPDGLLYLAMDYVDGPDLLDVINKDWPLEPGRIADLLSQALSALAVAHDLGVLHRDLKPENILVLRAIKDDGSPGETVKVCDFGIAKLSDASGEDVKVSTGSTVLGTPAYMSPEQARGEQLDARTDVYSMGVILYQMLTRRVPFDAPTALSTLFRVVNDTPPLPSTLGPDVDLRLEAICVKAMAKNAADRYDNARQMRAALRPVADVEAFSFPPGQPVVSPTVRTEADEELRLPARPGPKWAVMAVLLGAIAAIWVSLGRRDPVLATVVYGSAASRNATPEPTPALDTLAPLELPSSSAGERVPKSLATEEQAVAKVRAKGSVPPHGVEPLPDENNSPPLQGSTATITAGGSNEAQPSNPATPPPSAAASPRSPPFQGAASPAEAPRAPDFAAAHVEVGPPTSTFGTTAANATKALAPLGPKLDGCYRAALAQNSASDGPATLHLETNEEGFIVEARLDSSSGPLRTCIAAAVRGRRIANVDTGRASAEFPLAFKSR